MSSIDLNLDTQVQLDVLYKNPSWTITVSHDGISAILNLIISIEVVLCRGRCYSYYFYCCFVTEEDGEAVPGGQECAEGVPVAAGLWVLAGQAFR